jgi:hypothetical protein
LEGPYLPEHELSTVEWSQQTIYERFDIVPSQDVPHQQLFDKT